MSYFNYIKFRIKIIPKQLVVWWRYKKIKWELPSGGTRKALFQFQILTKPQPSVVRSPRKQHYFPVSNDCPSPSLVSKSSYIFACKSLITHRYSTHSALKVRQTDRQTDSLFTNIFCLYKVSASINSYGTNLKMFLIVCCSSDYVKNQ